MLNEVVLAPFKITALSVIHEKLQMYCLHMAKWLKELCHPIVKPLNVFIYLEHVIVTVCDCPSNQNTFTINTKVCCSFFPQSCLSFRTHLLTKYNVLHQNHSYNSKLHQVCLNARSSVKECYQS